MIEVIGLSYPGALSDVTLFSANVSNKTRHELTVPLALFNHIIIYNRVMLFVTTVFVSVRS